MLQQNSLDARAATTVGKPFRRILSRTTRLHLSAILAGEHDATCRTIAAAGQHEAPSVGVIACVTCVVWLKC